jgi:hypothetical protein
MHKKKKKKNEESNTKQKQQTIIPESQSKTETSAQVGLACLGAHLIIA